MMERMHAGQILQDTDKWHDVHPSMLHSHTPGWQRMLPCSMQLSCKGGAFPTL